MWSEPCHNDIKTCLWHFPQCSANLYSWKLMVISWVIIFHLSTDFQCRQTIIPKSENLNTLQVFSCWKKKKDREIATCSHFMMSNICARMGRDRTKFISAFRHLAWDLREQSVVSYCVLALHTVALTSDSFHVTHPRLREILSAAKIFTCFTSKRRTYTTFRTLASCSPKHANQKIPRPLKCPQTETRILQSIEQLTCQAEIARLHTSVAGLSGPLRPTLQKVVGRDLRPSPTSWQTCWIFVPTLVELWVLTPCQPSLVAVLVDPVT